MMILLCSKNPNILVRWKTVLDGLYAMAEVLSLEQLQTALASVPAPELVILHASLPGVEALEDLQALLRQHARIKFLVLSDKPNENMAFQLIRSGVYGYSNTYLSPALLLEAINQIRQGEIWMGKRLTRFLSECLLEDQNNEDTEAVAIEAGTFLARLTPKEKDVAKYVAHGCSNKCIANKLNITERTVKAHLSAIFEKTGIKDRVHLALLMSSHKYE